MSQFTFVEEYVKLIAKRRKQRVVRLSHLVEKSDDEALEKALADPANFDEEDAQTRFHQHLHDGENGGDSKEMQNSKRKVNKRRVSTGPKVAEMKTSDGVCAL